MPQGDGEGPMAAHRMAQDRLPFGVDRELPGDQLAKLFGYVAPHAIILCKGRLRGIDVKPGADSEIISAGGIARHTVATRTGIGRNKNQAEFGANSAIFTLLRNV